MLPPALHSKYRVIDRPGDDQWCQIYTAKDLESDEVVTVKILQEKLEEVSERGRRFLRSARNWSTLDYKGIVRLLDYGIADGNPFTVEAFHRATTLREYLSGSKPNLDFAIKTAIELASTLDFAHGHSIVHRNLKPENILIDESYEIVVSGWGMARAHEEKSNLTKTGFVMGTPGYVAPEQVLSGEADSRSDLYALGAVLYEMVAHRKPYGHREDLKVLQAQVSQKAPRLDKYAKAAPRELVDLVAELLARKPEDRPLSASLVCERLKSLEDIGGDLPTPSKKRTPLSKKKGLARSSQKKGRGRKLGFPSMVGGALLLLFIALLSLYYHWTDLTSIGTGSRGLAANIGLSVRSVELIDYERVLIRFSGKKVGFVNVSISTFEGNPIVKEPIEIPLKNGKSLSKSVFALELVLPQPLADKFLLTIGSFGSFPCDPARQIEKFLAPVSRLKSALPTLIPQAIKLKQSFAGRASAKGPKSKAEVRESFDDLMAKNGLARDRAKKLEEILPKLLNHSVLPGSPIACQLLPLRHIEAIVADKDGLIVPGGPLTKALGFAFSSNLDAKKEGWRQVGKTMLETPGLPKYVPGTAAGSKKDSLESPRGAWLICSVAKKEYERVMRSSAALKLLTGGQKSIVDYASASATSELFLNDDFAPLPEEARIDLTIGNWALDHFIELTINDSPTVTLLNTGVLSPEVPKRAITSSSG